MIPSPTRGPLMHTKIWPVAITLCFLAAVPADAEIIKGVMAIKGAEMS